MAKYPNCSVCLDETAIAWRVWHKHTAFAAAERFDTAGAREQRGAATVAFLARGRSAVPEVNQNGSARRETVDAADTFAGIPAGKNRG